MKSDVETLSPTRVKLTIEVPLEELTPAMDAAYKRIAASVMIPGFRKGKVPARIIDQRVGRGVVLEEAANEAVATSLDAALKEHDVKLLGRPQVDITALDGTSPLQYTAEVDVVPEFELPSYEGIEVVVDAAEISQDDVEKQLDALRGRFASVAPVERASNDGDLIVFDMTGSSDGDIVEDLRAASMSYALGSEGMIDGFDAAVIGASAQEIRTFTFTPEVGEWAGRAIDVEVTVTEVRERNLPPADDDFAALASEFDLIDELRDDIRERIGRVRAMEQAYAAREKVSDALLSSVDLAIPESYVDDQIEQHFADGHGDEGHRGEVREEIVNSLRSQLIFDRIAREQQLTVGQAELTTWLISQAPRYGMTPEQLANELAGGNQVQAAIAEVRRSKALAHVLEHASVTDTNGAVVDIAAATAPTFGDLADDDIDEDNLDDIDDIDEDKELDIDEADEVDGEGGQESDATVGSTRVD